MAEFTGCLHAKFSKLASVSDQEAALLAELESETREVAAGEALLIAGEPCDTLFSVNEGWLVSEAQRPDASTPVVSVFHAGDIAGFAQAAFRRAPYSIRAVTKSTVCPFPRANLQTLFAKSPRLGAIFLLDGMIASAIAQDRLMMVTQADAMGRISLFLAQTYHRLKLMQPGLHDQFWCPLTQTDIGNVTGLTSVYISRMFSRMERMDLISRHRSFIKLLDRPRIEELAEFANRYENLETGWLPPSSDTED